MGNLLQHTDMRRERLQQLLIEHFFAAEGTIDRSALTEAVGTLGIDPNKPDPVKV